MFSLFNKIFYGPNFTRIFTLATLFLLLFALFIVIPEKELLDDMEVHDNAAQARPNPFENISLEAKAAYVFDAREQKELFGINEQAQLPLASLTKLMTAFTAYELLPDYTIVTIDSDNLSAEGDSGFYKNEKWRLNDLLSFTLAVSSNDGASAIAAAAGSMENNLPELKENNDKSFVKAMNRNARDIGLTQTYFVNETGLDTSDFIGGGYGSARDAALLLEHIIVNAPEIADLTRHYNLEFISLSEILHTATNTNDAIGRIPGLIASKTGFTDLAGGNLAVAFDAGINHPIIVTVLGSTLEGRFRDVEKLVWASLNSLQSAGKSNFGIENLVQ
jgi:serine-type D-Ala-D-Ala carboxypeptidase (penicillin-binding protein 5/6)